MNGINDAQIDLGTLAGNLHALLDANESTDAGWTESDYGSLLDHQLSSPLLDDLSSIFSDVAEVLPATNCRTFGELLFNPPSSLPALKMVRHFAKNLITRDDRSYPDEVARVLYFAAIAAAQVHRSERITKLEPHPLREGYEWARSRSWISGELRDLFDQAVSV